ncbi:MAG TPA: undecaprenyl-diphosphate phosphatase, partial [Prosthecobacter sp.]|nr:undecaprenyl-diphosphate phosphatase [Prosthecobacter sp.]
PSLPPMPEWLTVIILGIIEGVTEFLPISSTGHLLIPQNFGWLGEPRSELFDVVIQSGAVIAVLAVFGKHVIHMGRSLGDPQTRDYLLKLAVAFLVTAVGGLGIKKLGIELPDTVPPVAWATLIGGLVIFLLEYQHRGKTGSNHITWAVAIAVGLAQILAAVFPGTSRSGASILMALALGIARPAATEFSFLLGVPTLMAAGAFKILSAIKDGEAAHEDWGMVALGTAVSAVSAFLVVKWLIRFVQSHTFNGFAVYRVLLGMALLLYLAVSKP